MKGKIKKWLPVMLPVVTMVMSMVVQTKASSLNENINITWTPDRLAFTTDAGETDYVAYDRGTIVDPGGEKTLPEPEEGQHTYPGKEMSEGNIFIEKWEVAYTPGQCVHVTENADFNHGISFGSAYCESAYKPGWFGYCADCYQRINILFYMDKETAQSISALPMGKDYYYKCPVCDNLEMAAEITHKCDAISWNQYTIIYKANSPVAKGYMVDSIFMYNNETVYEGEEITPETKLRKCIFILDGYEFVGWNTKPDGSGQSFADEEEIYNLTTEDKAELRLYAQWKKRENTLQIDPNGGLFNGKSEVTSVTQGYGTTFSVTSSGITSPKGYTVTFETNGGNEVPAQIAERSFSYWRLSDPFHGKLEKDTYTFQGANGSIDKITAIYENGSIVLPDCENEDSTVSFGGWYKDEECAIPAGKPGEEILITEDTVFYAKWVELKLTATDNYAAYEGAGAVDLSWTQADDTSKTYLLYQSLDRANWKKLSFSGSGEVVSVEEDFASTGTEKNYTVPYSGLYTIMATGAQGEDYDTHVGGKGGQVTATVWLSKGEILTYKIGTTEGYNGGGTGEPYGNGGGMTSVSSNLKGLLLVAGGGGGASTLYDGGAGGLSQSLVADSSNGGSGGAGGGGGYKGGTAGEAIVHTHTEDCFAKVTDSADSAFYGSTGLIAEGIGAYNGVIVYGNDFVNIDTRTTNCTAKLTLTTESFAVEPYAGILSFAVSNIDPPNDGTGNAYYTGDFYDAIYQVTVYDKDTGEVIYEIDDDDISYTSTKEYDVKCSISTCTYHRQIIDVSTYTDTVLTATRVDTSALTFCDHDNTTYKGYPHTEAVTYQFNIPIEKDVTNVYIKVYSEIKNPTTNNAGTWTGLKICDISYVCDVQTCGYTDGQVLSAHPSYGGSNYINTLFCTLKADKSGVGSGDGALQIMMEEAEYVDALSLDNVSAPDLVGPDEIDESKVTKTAVSADEIKIMWETPTDYGTTYYHRAESYSVERGEKLCDSNVTMNTLISGIKGYRYVIDTKASTGVTSAGSLTTANAMTVTMTETVQYLHLAVEDNAGNLSEVVHIKIGTIPSGVSPEEPLPPDVTGKLFTEQIVINCDNENIYASGEKTWYVKADGKTPFTLSFDAGMEGIPLSTYQINYMIFESELIRDGTTGRYQIYAPSATVTEEEIIYKASALETQISGTELVSGAAYTVATRKNSCKDMNLVRKFCVPSALDGETLSLIPIVGADYNGTVVYSDLAEDSLHGIKLIADAKAPEVAGAEILENLDSIDRESGSLLIDLTCSDTGSGVRELYAIVSNMDNYIEKKYRADADGHLRMDLTDEEDYAFKGDFTITIYAVDNVGNVTELSYVSSYFSLTANVTRLREPYEPMFKKGDYGILHITTGGYAEKVVIEALAPLFPGEKIIVYDEPELVKQEEIQFFVPLDAPEGLYKIVVKAYKGDKVLVANPELVTLEVSGTILDEFRRRIEW